MRHDENGGRVGVWWVVCVLCVVFLRFGWLQLLRNSWNMYSRKQEWAIDNHLGNMSRGMPIPNLFGTANRSQLHITALVHVLVVADPFVHCLFVCVSLPLITRVSSFVRLSTCLVLQGARSTIIAVAATSRSLRLASRLLCLFPPRVAENPTCSVLAL